MACAHQTVPTSSANDDYLMPHQVLAVDGESGWSFKRRICLAAARIESRLDVEVVEPQMAALMKEIFKASPIVEHMSAEVRRAFGEMAEVAAERALAVDRMCRKSHTLNKVAYFNDIDKEREDESDEEAKDGRAQLELERALKKTKVRDILSVQFRRATAKRCDSPRIKRKRDTHRAPAFMACQKDNEDTPTFVLRVASRILAESCGARNVADEEVTESLFDKERVLEGEPIREWYDRSNLQQRLAARRAVADFINAVVGLDRLAALAAEVFSIAASSLLSSAERKRAEELFRALLNGKDEVRERLQGEDLLNWLCGELDGQGGNDETME